MKLRKLVATAAASVIALSAAPAATAQDLGTIIGAIGIGDQVVGTVLDNTDCKTYETALKAIDDRTEVQLLTPTTTRNQLQQKLAGLSKEATANQGPLALAAARFSGKAADKALSCGLVKADPQLPGGLGELSSKFNDFAPALSSMLKQPK